MLIAFAALAGSAVAGKSPTVDEGYHAMAGWLHLWRGEYRFDSEDPPLWNTLAAVVTGPHTIRIDPQQLAWSSLPLDAGAEYKWEIQTLFRTAGNNPIAFLERFRAVMLAVAVAFGAFLAFFVWRLARAWGATPLASSAATILATALFVLDPNFLAHSPLMKNDVASAFALLGLTACTWAAGGALTVRRILALGVWSSIAMSVKFNGPLLIANSAVLLFLRAILSCPWLMGTRLCISRTRRLGAAALAVAVMGIMTFVSIWLSYGLRFAPSSEPGAQMNMSRVADACLVNVWDAKHWDGTAVNAPSKQQMDAMRPPMIVRLVGWANERHVLPQALLAGLLYVFQASQTRGTFLCGQSSSVGTWWYFPFAMAVKTPIATLAAIAAMAIAAAVGLFRRKGKASVSSNPTRPDSRVFRTEIWTAMCLGLPVAIYLAAAMSSNLNLGIRHVLPVYPFLFAAVGLAMSKLWDWHRATAMTLGLIVITALAVESCAAYPNYIPFFNVLAGGSRGGLRLLSDSNLDWGQDLPLLAEWQRKHPDQKLYLAYFGTPDPAYYGIRYTNITDGYWAGPPPEPMNSPGVLAISATTLQGTYADHRVGMPTWPTLWKIKPFEVLGGSIYLFHVPARPGDHLPPGQSLIN